MALVSFPGMGPFVFKPALNHLILICFTALLCVLPVKNARAQEMPTEQDVQSSMKNFHPQTLSFDDLKLLRKRFSEDPESVFNAPIGWLRASQNRISYERIRTKTIELLKKYDLKWKNGALKSPLPFDDHRSLTPDGKAIPVVLLPDGLAIIDGHHGALASLLVGAETVPVKIVLDLSQMRSNRAAWRKLVRLHMAYLKNLDGTYSEVPRPLNQLQNDPNRLLVSLTAKRIKTIKDGDRLVLEYADSSQDVWVKLDEGIPFIEFEIADILYRYGIVYRAEWGDQIPHKVVKKMRAILLGEKALGNPLLKNVALIRDDAPQAHRNEDPNLHFAGLISRTILTKKQGTEIKSTEGSKHPVWVSLEDASANARVEVAAALYRSGLNFDWQTQKNLSDAKIESARDAIAAQKDKDPKSLQDVAVVKKDQPRKKINFDKIFNVLTSQGQNCTRVLSI